jgi:hypothetical protein
MPRIRLPLQGAAQEADRAVPPGKVRRLAPRDAEIAPSDLRDDPVVVGIDHQGVPMELFDFSRVYQGSTSCASVWVNRVITAFVAP